MMIESTQRADHRRTGDRLLLFTTRGFRMFAYGLLSVVLVLYLKARTEGKQIGLLLTMTLLGDTAISSGSRRPRIASAGGGC